MASRRDHKEAARHARLATEQAAAARSAQRRRLGVIGGVVAVAVIVAVVAVAVSSSGAKKLGIQTGTVATATYAKVAVELRGIPQHGTTLGTPTAPVTIQYFGDLECPVCQAFTLGEEGSGLPQLIAGPVRAGQVKIEYRSLETASGAVNHDRFMPQQVAAYAAGRQDLFWNYAELFYREQGSEDDRYVTESYLQGLAKQIPSLNFASWMTARTDGSLATQIRGDAKAAQADAIHATPTLVASGPRSELVVPAASGIPTFAELTSAIRSAS